jgi:methyl-accepting chemotaxis protein
MYESVNRQDILNQLRRRVARATLNYPTDPINGGVAITGTVLLVVTVLSGAPIEMIISSALTLIAGIVGFAVARSKYVRYILQVTLFGATLSLLLNFLTFATIPLWWVLLIPLGAVVSGSVLFYWGVRLSAIWYVIEAVTALVAILLASTTVNDATPLWQALVAGETMLFLLHAGILVFMPEQLEAQARNAAVNRQRYELSNLAQQISATADGLGKASTAIHQVTSQQGSGAEQQAAVITEAVTMLNEFIALADEIRNQARNIKELSEQTAAVSEHGRQSIQTATEGMSQIRSQVTVIALNITGLAEQMQRIDEIIATVSEIATQSNLLALNASIEAARAGKHGRGFAVVADEVRTLSQQSKAAAAQVQNILSEINEAMKQTIRATEVGDEQVDEGLDLSKQAGEVIQQLANNIDESAEAMRNIMVAIDQQSTGLEEITQSMRNIHDVTQQNLESTKTAEIVAENLNRLSEELLNAIARHPAGTTLS